MQPLDLLIALAAALLLAGLLYALARIELAARRADPADQPADVIDLLIARHDRRKESRKDEEGNLQRMRQAVRQGRDDL